MHILRGAIGATAERDAGRQVAIVRAPHTFIWAPSSTTRSEGIWKKSGALAACLVIAMNNLSCHCGMPDVAEAFRVRRPTKNEVVMMSNFRPALRIIASALGRRGDSI